MSRTPKFWHTYVIMDSDFMVIVKPWSVEVDFLAEGASDAVEVLPSKYNLETGEKQSTFHLCFFALSRGE